MAKKRELTENV